MAPWIFVNIGSGSDLLHESWEPLPDPMLADRQLDPSDIFE